MTRSEPTTPRTGASVPPLPLGKPHASETARLPAELEGRAPLTYRGEPVLTTELAAKAFGAEEKALRNNFDRNEGRFKEGKHFYKIEGTELRALKDSASFRGSVGANAKSLTLWTERGIARHAKILETETAWAIFEALEDTYFRAREHSAPVGKPDDADRVRVMAAREARLTFNNLLQVCKTAGVTGGHALLAANSGTREMVGIDYLGAAGLPRLPSDIGGAQLNATDVGRPLGLSDRETNKALTEHGYQTVQRSAKGRLVYEPTPKGEQNGGRLTLTGKKHSNGTPVTQLVWSSATTRALGTDLKRGESL